MSDQIIHTFGKIKAVRYGTVHGEWEDGAASRIAQFVLGQNITNSITPLNDVLMRVVQPVDDFWDPKKGVADITVTDPVSGTRIALGLGDWIARYPSGVLRPLAHNKVTAEYLPPPPTESFEVELAAVLAKHNRQKGSGTPVDGLADYLIGCLSAYNTVIRKRAALRNESVN